MTTDPRARILKKLSEEFSHEGGEPNWYAITEATERAAHEQKGLWPNVDLYSGSLYRYLGIPNDLFTPLFECSRVAARRLTCSSSTRTTRSSGRPGSTSARTRAVFLSTAPERRLVR